MRQQHFINRDHRISIDKKQMLTLLGSKLSGVIFFDLFVRWHPHLKNGKREGNFNEVLLIKFIHHLNDRIMIKKSF